MIGLILAAAGAGVRFGTPIPKQFVSCEGTPVYLRALQAFEPHFREAVVVVPAGWISAVRDQLCIRPFKNRVVVEAGGEQRQDSVECGLRLLGSEIDLVLVHDAARPFVSTPLINSVIEATRRHGAAIPGLAVSDTVKEVESGFVSRTLDRQRLVLVQTPQGFKRDVLEAAYDRALKDDFHGTDEAMLVERLGISVFVVPGEPENRKITWRKDLAV